MLTLFKFSTDVRLFSFLYQSPLYSFSLFSDLPVQGQTPCTAHAALKQLIKRLIEESLSLSVLQTAQDHPAVPRDDENRTYEDLLATAIINKVIKKNVEDSIWYRNKINK